MPVEHLRDVVFGVRRDADDALGLLAVAEEDQGRGALTFGDNWGWGEAKEEAHKVYNAFREAGGNFIDTANMYTNRKQFLTGSYIL
jgi:Aldo/keto reductase family